MALLDSMMGMQGFSPMQRLQVLGPVALQMMQRQPMGQPGMMGGMGGLLQALLAARQRAGGMLPMGPQGMPPNITPGMLPGQVPNVLPRPALPPTNPYEVGQGVPLGGYEMVSQPMVNLGFGGVR